jgi:NAD(P)-dependent dehydrogenase (short-subunit alcohol dehydrogenase family)
MAAMKLDGKIALVTGGARRVGRAIAEELARAGATVAIHHHASRAAAAEAAARIKKAMVVQADLSTLDGCVAAVEAVRKRHGHIDILVNSAAGYARSPFAYEDDANWEKLLALNLVAPARLVKRAMGIGLSSVVNIVDVAAWQPWKHHAAYAASKAGLLQLTRNLALELAPSVRVNAVAPGTVAFPPDFSEAERNAVTDRIPMERIGEPADVARAVRYLCEEPFLTGAVITVDGGAGLR